MIIFKYRLSFNDHIFNGYIFTYKKPFKSLFSFIISLTFVIPTNIYIFHFIFMDFNNFLLEIFFMMMTLTMILNYLQQQRLLKKSNKLMRNDFFPSSRETWRLYIYISSFIYRLDKRFHFQPKPTNPKNS